MQAKPETQGADQIRTGVSVHSTDPLAFSASGEPFPATRVDNWIIFRGGHSRKLTLGERFRLWRDPATLVSA